MKRAWLVGAVLASLAAACAVGAPRLSQTPTLSAPSTPAPTATAMPSPALSVSPPPTLPSTAVPSLSAGTASCPADTAEPATPPDASIADAGGSPVIGRVGSYDYCGTGADALPPKAANVTAVALGAPPTVTLSLATGGDGFNAYRATYWTASEWQGDEINLASDSFDAPVWSTSFAGPPAGDWMLAVTLTFASGGDSLYYWHVTAP